MHALDQISHAVREFHYFTLSLDVEIDCGITCGSAINRLFQINQAEWARKRVDEKCNRIDLANEADPRDP